MMSVLNNQWGAWNEGDDMIFIDGEKTPRINGTGGEDYFNGAWGFGPLYSTPYGRNRRVHGRAARVDGLPCTAGI